MAEPFIGQVSMVAFNFAPKGWALCNGQLLPINQNQALFSILGTTYGGDGRTTFALPNLQGRAPVHASGGAIILGEASGEESHTLSNSEMPAHTHLPGGDSTTVNQGSCTNHIFGMKSGTNLYSDVAPNASLNPAAIGNAGGSQPHTNLQPYLVINFIIALQGIFPSRN